MMMTDAGQMHKLIAAAQTHTTLHKLREQAAQEEYRNKNAFNARRDEGTAARVQRPLHAAATVPGRPL